MADIINIRSVMRSSAKGTLTEASKYDFDEIVIVGLKAGTVTSIWSGLHKKQEMIGALEILKHDLLSAEE